MSTVKSAWPEVVGWPATAAVTRINSDRPDIDRHRGDPGRHPRGPWAVQQQARPRLL
jgi:hypothetical protein